MNHTIRFFLAVFCLAALSVQAELPMPFPKKFGAKFAVRSGSGKDVPHPNRIFDGSKDTYCTISSLEDSEIEVNFPDKVTIGSLTLTQMERGTGAMPSLLEINIDDKCVRLVQLVNAPDELQFVPINDTVSKLLIRVVGTYSHGRSIQHGFIGEIGYSEKCPVPAAMPKSGKGAVDAVAAGDKAMNALCGTIIQPFIFVPGQLDNFILTAVTPKNKLPRKLKSVFNPKRGEAVFNPIKGSQIAIDYKSPHKVGIFAFQPGKYGNWARIKELGVSIDGGAEQKWNFEDTEDAQGVIINAEVRRLVFTVNEVYGKDGLGGYAQLGEAKMGPVIFKTAEKPFPMAARELEVVIDSEKELSVTVDANVSSYRLLYNGPTLALKPGRNVLRVKLDDFRESGAYGVDWSACHICNLNFNLPEKDSLAKISLVDVKPILPSGASENMWYDLGTFAPPTKEINGSRWTEGMSYSSGGRFGNSVYNGLLEEVVGHLWFHTYTAGPTEQHVRQKFDVYVEGNDTISADAIDTAQYWKTNGTNYDKNDKIDVSWTHMSRTMQLKNGGQFSWLVSTLMPGFLGESNRPFTISSRGGGDIPKRSGAPDEDENRFFEDANSTSKIKQGPTMVITPDGVMQGEGNVQLDKLSAPWIVAVWGGMKHTAFWGDKAAAVLFTMDGGQISWNRSGVNFPAGKIGISSSFHTLFNDNWEVEKIRERANILCGMLRNYPYQCREYYRIEGNTLHIHDEFTYAPWGKEQFRAKNFAPLPPIFTWGAISSNWGSLPIDESRMLKTPSGPYAWCIGDAVDFTLPIPENRHALFPRNKDFDDIYAKVAQSFLKQPMPTEEELHRIVDAWRISFTPLRVGSSSLGLGYLGKDYREKVLSLLKVTSANAFMDYGWMPRKEVFGHHRYLTSLWVDNKVSPVMYGDVNSGIGTACYALYMYSKYSGDWEQARRLFPRVLDVIRFAEVVNDWAIPMTSAREGVLFGGIDMDTIGYVGISAADMLARQVGTREEQDRLLYLRGKLATSVALRMTYQKYLDPEGKYPPLWVNGFSESGPCLEWAKPTSSVGLDHNSMTYCWQGQQPEMFQLLMQLPGAAAMEEIQKNLMDKCFTGENFSGWRKMRVNRVRTSAHLTMRAWLGWDRGELERDYNIWIQHSPADLTSRNAGFFNVYYGSLDGIYLINWEPAAMELLEYDRASGKMTATMHSSVPFTIEGCVPKHISAIKVDGKDYPVSEVQYKNNMFRLKLKQVKTQIEFLF